MKKIVHIVLLVTLIFTTFYFGAPLSQNQTAKASFDPNNLVADAAFINVEGISAAGIQDLFNTTGTFLKTYSENGRSAARIVYDAAHGYGDASGALNGIDINSSTGTINPVAILATLQKEQGLVTGGASVTLNQSALNAAMGYGCPDGGGCNDAYVGFTKQIENAAWQLRYNYERAQGHGFSDYQVGQTATIDGQSVTYSNRATASLYRYTPHLGQNFTTYFNLWSTIYQYSFVSQSAYPTIRQNETAYFNLTVRNTGSATWTSSMHLGTDRGRDRITGFVRRENWSSPNRITMLESSVAP
ncbi:TPA: hypothetical protein DD449_04030, partial [Candidatus Berkelbacteria bacterium]|nr:hypothetical protein [Candidatus Berkelbacteria bacterium]